MVDTNNILNKKLIWSPTHRDFRGILIVHLCFKSQAEAFPCVWYVDVTSFCAVTVSELNRTPWTSVPEICLDIYEKTMALPRTKPQGKLLPCITSFQQHNDPDRLQQPTEMKGFSWQEIWHYGFVEICSRLVLLQILECWILCGYVAQCIQCILCVTLILLL